jgi:hypothetical protein
MSEKWEITTQLNIFGANVYFYNTILFDHCGLNNRTSFSLKFLNDKRKSYFLMGFFDEVACPYIPFLWLNIPPSPTSIAYFGKYYI